MKVIGCDGTVIICGTKEEIRKWEEEHREYIDRGTFDSGKYLYKPPLNMNIYYAKNTKEQCLRDAAISAEAYELYGK